MPDQSYEDDWRKAVKAEQGRLPRHRNGRSDRLLAGISLSGGGIRSATFNLGILQELERLGLLRYFDYLSTVSGGGYIGSWFAACRKNGIPLLRWCGSGPEARENESFHHLRRYSRYLTPQGGILSIDTLTTAGIILRNMLLNQGTLIAFLALVLLLPRFVEKAFRHQWTSEVLAALTVVSFGLLFLGVLQVRSWLPKVGKPGGADPWRVVAGFAAPVSVCNVLFSLVLWQHHLFLDDHPWLQHAAAAAFVLGSVLLVRSSVDDRVSRARRIGLSILTGAANGVIVFGFGNHLLGLADRLGVTGSLVVMPAVLLTMAAVAVMSMIGLMGRALDDGKREWWSRAGALFALAAGTWTLLAPIALWVPELWKQAGGFSGLGVAVASWLATAGGAYRMASSLTSRSEKKESAGSSWLLTLGAIVSIFFILGTLCAVAIFDAKLIQWAESQPWAKGCPLLALLATAAALSVLALVFGFQFDVNEFSLNHFYRNRLVRCYMGAARYPRSPDNFTGLDFSDDFDIDQIKPWGGYDGPFHIVNTSLNLAKPHDLAIQDRKADSFSITPLYIGSKTTGYREATGYMYEGRSIKLGTAVAISGAAASPNMGNLTSPALAFVMTLFNVRLGWWVAHPDPKRGGTEASPRFALWYLLKELFTATTDSDRYLYLSDGGHFENLGAYELVRRRCHLIVIGDGSADPDYHFDDLGNFIRLCRLDFNTEIEIDPVQISDRKERFGKAHCAVGRIRYPDAPPGTIIYLKSSLCGDEPPDVLHYATAAPTFPHETTADQFFSETQFEGYRALGEHIARETFEKAMKDWRIAEGDEGMKRPSIENLAKALRLSWFAPARSALNFTRHTENLERIWEQLRTNRHIGFLDAQLFPSWPALVGDASPRTPSNQWLPRSERELREAFYVCQSVLQLMENVYTDVDLEREHNHPDNRGWMNLFRHWTGSSMLRVTWALSCQTYGARFQNFLRRELELRNEDGMDFEEEMPVAGCNPVEQAEFAALQRDQGIVNAALVGVFVNVKSPLDQAQVFRFRVALIAVTLDQDGTRAFRWIRVQAQLRQMGIGRAAIEQYRGWLARKGAALKLLDGAGTEAEEWVRSVLPDEKPTAR